MVCLQQGSFLGMIFTALCLCLFSSEYTVAFTLIQPFAHVKPAFTRFEPQLRPGLSRTMPSQLLQMQLGGLFKGFSGGGKRLAPEKFSFPAASGPQPSAASATLAGKSDGRSKQNQDAVVQVVPLVEDINMYAVFDGHGPNGQKIASFLAKTSPGVLADSITGLMDYGATYAVTCAFLTLDEAAWTALGVEPLAASGATATVVLHRGNGLLVACVGDSRAVVGG
eukprot:CAMPEP_0181295446 /NCGR_PEP_ID=MMETSP1101-20121128/4156_1 /TAXON_ID=46948 /ORGANISM="Rhodomonas abbreviata, Strain Caron Lab Isolate" /LENGTH=223 /DNA_ID=CAMNT_0023400207 /DNA_START=147 /DNA_END=814 /DNA_ORIENTATION=-